MKPLELERVCPLPEGCSSEQRTFPENFPQRRTDAPAVTAVSACRNIEGEGAATWPVVAKERVVSTYVMSTRAEPSTGPSSQHGLLFPLKVFKKCSGRRLIEHKTKKALHGIASTHAPATRKKSAGSEATLKQRYPRSAGKWEVVALVMSF